MHDPDDDDDAVARSPLPAHLLQQAERLQETLVRARGVLGPDDPFLLALQAQAERYVALMREASHPA